MSEWIEAGTGAKYRTDDNLLGAINSKDLSLTDNEQYQTIVKKLRKVHIKLVQLQGEGKLGNYAENPALIGDYMGDLRLNANLLYTFMNSYIEILSGMQEEHALKREGIYRDQLSEGKSPSAAEKHAREMTRVDESKVEIIKNAINQVRNEYERYNGIVMYLQSRLKEFNTERMIDR